MARQHLTSRCRYWRIMLPAILWLCVSHAVALTCQDSGADLYVRLPSVISIPVGITPGTILGEFVDATDAGRWACQGADGAANTIGLGFKGFLPPSARQYTHINGKRYAIFQSNLPYIGLLAEFTLMLETASHQLKEIVVPVTQANTTLATLAAGLRRGNGAAPTQNLHIQIKKIRLALVYTGGQPLAAGAVAAGELGQVGVTSDGGMMQFTHRIHHSAVQLVAPTCAVQDLTVSMPAHGVQDFIAHGVQAGRWQPFVIDINHCPTGIRRMRYRLVRPRYGLLDEELQVMRGGPQNTFSSAQGIGIQMATDTLSATVIRYGSDYDVAEHHPNNTHWRIPLKARYVKPAGMQASAGSVNAAVTFEISYE
jgi:type 1 fimbria pilin